MTPRFHAWNSRAILFAAVTAIAAGSPALLSAQSLGAWAGRMRSDLTERVLPYWYRTVDSERGGYLLYDHLEDAQPATEKQLVTQSRMVWTFSHAVVYGFSDPERDYLEAARQGYQFLLDHFLDPESGGYFWKTDLEGRVLGDRKELYGQAFVVYALVEYHRAGGDPEPLRRALNLYEKIQKHWHDDRYGGWYEHADREWNRLLPDRGERPAVDVGVAGYKSGNAHLHWMEALTELYDASHRKDVKKSLLEAVKINARHFFPKDGARAVYFCEPDWEPVNDARYRGVSYGHNVEAAWLLVRARRMLDQSPPWSHFESLLEHALERGYDHLRGGLYDEGYENAPAHRRDKTWWVQAEMLAALTEGLTHDPDNLRYRKSLESLLKWIDEYQIRSDDRIWLDAIYQEGKIKNAAKAHSWKAAYHDVRAMVKFIRAFGGSG